MTARRTADQRAARQLLQYLLRQYTAWSVVRERYQQLALRHCTQCSSPEIAITFTDGDRWCRRCLEADLRTAGIETDGGYLP